MSPGIAARRTGMTEAAAIEPIRTAMESTATAASTAAKAPTAAKASASAAAPPCQHVGRTCEREYTDHNQDLQRKSRGDAQIHFAPHGRYSLTFRNSMRFASLGIRGLNFASEICFGN